MVEVDTVFIIKRPAAVLEIVRPYLHELELNDSSRLVKHFKKPQLSEVTKRVFQEASDNRKVGRFEKYRKREEILLQELHNGTRFRDRVPIFINGLSPTNYSSGFKVGIDPFSNMHLFSTLFLETVGENFPTEFLEKILLFYVQPVTHIQRVVDVEGNVGLEDIIRDRIEEEIDKEIKGIGFGTLAKFDDESPKIGNSRYDPSVFSANYIRRHLTLNPHDFDEEATFNGTIDYAKLLKLRKLEALLNVELNAAKFARILDLLNPNILEVMRFFDIDGIPLYMEKTSDSTKVMEHAKRYTQKYVGLRFIGGDRGILATTPERIPLLGICHPSAIGRLVGFLEDMHMTWKQRYERRFITIDVKPQQSQISFAMGEKYPFFLLENGTENKHPNLHDLVDVLISRGELTKEDVQDVARFADIHRVGFSRIEPRIVSLFTNDVSIYDGLRRFNKTNRRWFSELSDKLIITPDQVPGFSELDSVADKVGDFRGSEFSLRTSPLIDENWLQKFRRGNIDSGCSIEKILSGIEESKKKDLLREAIKFAYQPDLEEFSQFCDLNSLRSARRIVGTAVHKISSAALNGLVHYETLQRANLRPVPSDRYTETPFYYELELGGRRFSVSMHPDAYIFLKGDENNYNIVILDTKTNSVKASVEHRYLQQTFFYGWLLKKIMKDKLDININNIYCVLNKNAFYRPIKDEKLVIPHSMYRGQAFSPITLFEASNVMHDIVPAMLATIIEEKDRLRADSSTFVPYKEDREQIGRCQQCYKENKILCDYVARRANVGEDVRFLI